ncbi:NAD(P)-dependent oxidoreductase [Phenylobacterium sp.]|uniref:NAD-dependent epimerase/dehydratase family protein n=1 Tax=Phenylobacterium sp. TaxID=1871053 RepID=UPI002F4130B3
MAGACTIVGAAGFVGAALDARLRAQGLNPYAPAKGDPELLARDLGCVFYCAGLTADYAARPFDTVEAHAALPAEIARRGRFERFIYLSSTRLYDGGAAAEPVREDAPLMLRPAEPRHIYDLSKALGENIALTRMDGRGAAARLSNVFGWNDGDPGFLSEWLARARTGRTLELESSPHVARDYIHLDDVVDALIAMSEAQSPGIVNVASGELVTNAALAEVFAAEGWTISFRGDADPPPPPCADVGRLRALGVAPRPVLDVVRGYLQAAARP